MNKVVKNVLKAKTQKQKKVLVTFKVDRELRERFSSKIKSLGVTATEFFEESMKLLIKEEEK